MALTNAQYDSIMRDYQAQQISNRHAVEEKKNKLYSAVPELQELDNQIATISIEAAKARLLGEAGDSDDLRNQIDSIRDKKKRLIEGAGFSLDYLIPPYRCPDCQDTGYINGFRCHCLKQASLDLIYKQANLSNILSRENFDTFSLEYYSDSDFDAKGLSSRENAKKAFAECQEFCNNFSENGGNIFLYGNTGVGKTFLSNCIAKSLLDDGHSVIYTTAIQLFDIFDDHKFYRGGYSLEDYENIFSCDLLIIDDLGTESDTKFTSSQFFMCLNERMLRQKSTIISTNLSIAQFSERYSERTFSRVTSAYSFIKLWGSDIRMKKKLQ